MSLLKTIDTNPTFTPKESKALPERVISGDPAFKTWPQDVCRGEMIHTGVWEATPARPNPSKARALNTAISCRA